MWIVYDHPADYPEGFLARRWLAGAMAAEPTQTAVVGATLEAVRAQLPIGLIRLARDPEDDPVIVETWM